MQAARLGPLLFLVVCLLIPSRASAEQGYDTVWDRLMKTDWGLYLTMSGKRMPVQDEQVFLPGATVGVTMNDWVWVGGFYRPLKGSVKYKPEGAEEKESYDIEGKTYGAEIGVNFWSPQIVHFHLATFLGAAQIEASGDTLAEPVYNDYRGGEIELQAEINFTAHVRFGIGSGYRFGSDKSDNLIKAKDLRGLTYGAFLRLLTL